MREVFFDAMLFNPLSTLFACNNRDKPQVAIYCRVCHAYLVLHIYFPMGFRFDSGPIFDLNQLQYPLFVGLCALRSGIVCALFFGLRFT